MNITGYRLVRLKLYERLERRVDLAPTWTSQGVDVVGDGFPIRTIGAPLRYTGNRVDWPSDGEDGGF